jgi:hypothetical protein
MNKNEDLTRCVRPNVSRETLGTKPPLELVVTQPALPAALSIGPLADAPAIGETIRVNGINYRMLDAVYHASTGYFISLARE